MVSYEGDIPNTETKPFSAMQGGGTGFLVTTINSSRQNELCFLPNVSTTGASTWRWTTSGIVPRSGIYYHVIGVWNKEEGKAYIYVDGELKNTIDAPGDFRFAASGNNWFCVGGDPNGSSGHQSWNGDVVIARVYDKPLTQADVTNLWDKVLHPNAIDEITESKPTAPRGIFNLNGMRVEKPQHGVYIIDGKKKLVK